MRPRQVFKTTIIAAHNHFSMNLDPSKEDVWIMRQFVGGRLMGVPVHNHLIVTDGGCTSLAEREVMG